MVRRRRALAEVASVRSLTGCRCRSETAGPRAALGGPRRSCQGRCWQTTLNWLTHPMQYLVDAGAPMTCTPIAYSPGWHWLADCPGFGLVHGPYVGPGATMGAPLAMVPKLGEVGEFSWANEAQFNSVATANTLANNNLIISSRKLQTWRGYIHSAKQPILDLIQPATRNQCRIFRAVVWCNRGVGLNPTVQTKKPPLGGGRLRRHVHPGEGGRRKSFNEA
jgi:hypothetical protein